MTLQFPKCKCYAFVDKCPWVSLLLIKFKEDSRYCSHEPKHRINYTNPITHRQGHILCRCRTVRPLFTMIRLFVFKYIKTMFTLRRLLAMPLSSTVFVWIINTILIIIENKRPASKNGCFKLTLVMNHLRCNSNS